jgi:hypothetical protein
MARDSIGSPNIPLHYWPVECDLVLTGAADPCGNKAASPHLRREVMANLLGKVRRRASVPMHRVQWCKEGAMREATTKVAPESQSCEVRQWGRAHPGDSGLRIWWCRRRHGARSDRVWVQDTLLVPFYVVPAQGQLRPNSLESE